MVLRIVGFILLIVLGVFLAPFAADAEQPSKVRQIGYLVGVTPEVVEPLTAAFRQGLRDLGWVEGQNIAIHYRSAYGRFERFPDLAAELVRLKVDLIAVASTPGVLAAKNATKTIPIVILAAHDPVGSGLVASLARPGGNVTGLSLISPELVGKQLELLKEAVPGLSRVAVLWNPANPGGATLLREAEVGARSLRLRLQPMGVRGPEEFDGAFAAMTRERADALLVLADSLLLSHRKRLADLAAKNRLPAMYGLREHAEAGALMVYAANLADLLRRAATYVDKILKGAKPGDLPVEQPTKFELIVNLRTAKALGLTIPPSIFIRADKVIE